jgi:hypothetical protein
MARAGGTYQRKGPRSKAHLVARTYDPRHIPPGEEPVSDPVPDTEPEAAASEDAQEE